MLHVSQSRSNEKDLKCVFFGLSRDDASYVSYKSIEILKDGIGFSGKYEAHDILFNPPHVVILSNFAPNLSSLSLDRWIITHIDCIKSDV